jgi:hypothetical protein
MIDAHLALSRLWSEAGRDAEASRLMRRGRQALVSQGGALIPVAAPARTSLIEIAPTHAIQSVESRLRPFLASDVEITVEAMGGARAIEPFGRSRPSLDVLANHRSELPMPLESSLRVLNLGEREAGEEKSTGVRLAIVHRESAETKAIVTVPARSREADPSLQSDRGSLLPLAESGVHGLSLIDGRLAWSLTPAKQPRRAQRLRLGPCGVGYCVVQTAEGIVCLEPATGAVLWQRRDIAAAPLGEGRQHETVLFGDERHLVVFEEDQVNFHVLSMTSGARVRSGRIDIVAEDLRRRRHALGSRLFYVGRVDGEARYRLWDPVSDRILFEVPAHPRMCEQRVDRQHVACLAANGEVQVLSILGRVKAVHAVPDEQLESVTGVGALRDSDAWYVHVDHSLPVASGIRYESAASEVHLPGFHVDGTLTAYDADSGARLWSVALENRTLLRDPHCDWPFLCAISRVRDGSPGHSSSLLLEVLDRRSGSVLASEAGLERTPLLHVESPDPNELALYTAESRIRIRCRSARDRFVVTAEHETTQTR